MTDRERWTIYPLLFLALGIAVKDKIGKLVDTDRLQCRTLVVTDKQGHQQFAIEGTPAGGVLRTAGVVSADKLQCRGILITDREGHGQIAFEATPTGGTLRTSGTVSAEHLQCRTLVATDAENKDQVVIATTPAGGFVRTHSPPSGRISLLGYVGVLGGLINTDGTGKPIQWSFEVPEAAQLEAAPQEAAPEEAAPDTEQPPKDDQQPQSPAEPELQ